jgi:hypothetical protein
MGAAYTPGVASLVDLDGGSLTADEVEAMVCDPEPTSSRPVIVRNGTLSGRLDLAHCTLHRPLIVEHVDIPDGIDLTEASLLSLRVSDAEIGDIAARGVRAKHVLSIEDCRVSRAIDLIECEIQDALFLSRTTVSNPAGDENENAINLYGSRLRAAAYLVETVIDHGALRLIDSTVDGILDLTGLVVRSCEGTAVFCDRVEAPSLHLRGATINGRVSITAADIAGTISLTEATIDNASDRALTLDSATCRRLMFRNANIRGDVSLRSATVGALVDNRRSWSGVTVVETDGFVYGRFGDPKRETELTSESEVDDEIPGDLTPDDRIKILCQRNGEYSSMPYAQLRSVYRSSGNEAAAIDVAVAGAKDRIDRDRPRRECDDQPERGGFRQLGKLAAPFGYGYRPLRAAAFLIGTIVLLAVLVTLWDSALSAKPVDDPGPSPSAATAEGPDGVERIAYATDVVLPIIDLGEADRWQIDSEAPGGSALRVSVWIAIILGWVFSTTFVIAVQRLFRDP